MKTRATLFLLSTVVLSADANEPKGLDSRLQKLVEQIATASDAEKAAVGYIALFKNPDRKLLAQLKQVRQTGVALRAAWEEVLLAGLIPGKQPDSKIVQPEAAERFLGFVEGRLGISLPAWWEESVRRASLGGCNRVCAGRPKSWADDRNPKDLVASLRKQSVTISPALAENLLRGHADIKAHLNAESCFLAFHK
jgi:hypothetical protein